MGRAHRGTRDREGAARRTLIRPGVAAGLALAVGALVFLLGRPDPRGVLTLENLSAAMAPTIAVRQRLLVDRDAYRDGRSPARGDVVLVEPTERVRRTCGSGGYPLPPPVLRVVGVPGERVVVRDGRAYVGGRPVDPPAVRPPAGTDDRAFPPVPPDALLLLGDNRRVACDARVWGATGDAFTPNEEVIGRVVGVE